MAAIDIGLIAVGSGLIAVTMFLWIWFPYLTRKPRPQHDQRELHGEPRERAFEDLPRRTTVREPAAVAEVAQRQNGDLPETWTEYLRELHEKERS